MKSDVGLLDYVGLLDCLESNLSVLLIPSIREVLTIAGDFLSFLLSTFWVSGLTCLKPFAFVV